MTTELMKIDWSDPAMVQTMRETVAKGSSDEEFKLFCAIAKSTGLNPFLKQIWFIKPNKYQNKRGEWVQPPAQSMTGIDGYRAIANTHPQYDGTEIETTRDKDGKPVKCVVKVHRKDRKFPATAEVLFKEYYKPGLNGKESIWDKNGTVMIEKVGESLGLRRAFPLEVGSIRTFEEMGIDETNLTQDDKNAAVEAEAEPVDMRVFYDIEIRDDDGMPLLDEKGKAAARKYLLENHATFSEELKVFVSESGELELCKAIIAPKDEILKRARQQELRDGVKTAEELAAVEAAARIQAVNEQLANRDNQ